jgi:predicted Zn-dependent protease
MKTIALFLKLKIAFFALMLFSMSARYSVAQESLFIKNCDDQLSLVVPYASLQEYVQSVATRIAKANNIGQSVPTEVFLVTGNINACAGMVDRNGFIYVQTALLQFAKTEDEIAAVMAHEMSHINLNHSRPTAKSLGTNALFELLSSILASRMAPNSELLKLAQGGINVGNFLLQNKYERGQEFDADKQGVLLMTAAGYNPNAASTIFVRMAQKQGNRSSLEGLELDHPLLPSRIKRIQSIIAELPIQARGLDYTGAVRHSAALSALSQINPKLQEIVQTAEAQLSRSDQPQLAKSAGQDEQAGGDSFIQRQTGPLLQHNPGKQPHPTARLGIEINNISDQDLARMGLRPGAARIVVQRVESGSPAQRMGIASGDLLVAIDNVNLADSVSLLNLVPRLVSGSVVQASVLRFIKMPVDNQSHWFVLKLKTIWP